jgi:superfamily I DNA/RNA helicase
VEDYLTAVGLVTADQQEELTERERAFEILLLNQNSNLGWRVILGVGNEDIARDLIRLANEKGVPLFEVIPNIDRTAVLREAQEWSAKRGPKKGDEGTASAAPKVKVTSFEGAKGLSAQYVFLIGLHSGDMPRNAAAILDIEICRFLVGMTRTKKKCSILVTNRFGDQFKRRSEFLSWIKTERFEEKKVNAAYWKK